MPGKGGLGTEWTSDIHWGVHACFFYNSTEEFFEVTLPYLSYGLVQQKVRTLWIVPESVGIPRCVKKLERFIGFPLDAAVAIRRLLLVPWEKWYGKAHPWDLEGAFQKWRLTLKEALREGYAGLRIVTHGLPQNCSCWPTFVEAERLTDRQIRMKPMSCLCAYDWSTLPKEISQEIAESHSFSLIHRPVGWVKFKEAESKSMIF